MSPEKQKSVLCPKKTPIAVYSQLSTFVLCIEIPGVARKYLDEPGQALSGESAGRPSLCLGPASRPER
jgi:hypothetical protein